jgi:hypothetical protein
VNETIKATEIREIDIQKIIAAIPPQPHGNIDGEIAPRLQNLLAGRIVTLDDLAEVNGLIARAIHLANRRPPPTGFYPESGAPIAMAA